jgi:hypothetical protein
LRLSRTGDQPATQLVLQAIMDESSELFCVGSRQEDSCTRPVLAAEAGM